MQKPIRSLSLLFILWARSLFSFLHPESTRWNVIGEFLYLLPSVDDTYFVIQAQSPQISVIGNRENNDFGFRQGFRLGVVYGFCDCDQEIQVFYSRLNTSAHKTIDGTLWATKGDALFINAFENYTGTAISSLDLLYQRFDALFSQEVYCGQDWNLYLKAGLEFGYVRFKEKYIYQSTFTGIANLKSKTYGVGPQCGTDVNCDLWEFYYCGYPGKISLVGNVSASLLASQVTTQETDEILDETFLNVEDRRTWRMVPAFHMRAGLNYATFLSCFGASFEVGYEFNTYIRALSRTEFPNSIANGLCYMDYYNFDMQGLYIEATVTF